MPQYSVEELFNMLQIKDPKPKLEFSRKGNNDAVFGVTTLTFNEADHTFNQVGDIFGGADRISDIGPNFSGHAIEDIKPRILEIKNL